MGVSFYKKGRQKKTLLLSAGSYFSIFKKEKSGM
jgi:hypothetical protein